MKKINVLVLIGSPIIRMTIRKILNKYPDIEVIAYLKNDFEVDELLNKSKDLIDVIIADINLRNFEILVKKIISKNKTIGCIIICEDSEKPSKFLSKVFEFEFLDFLYFSAHPHKIDKFELELINKIRGLTTLNVEKITKREGANKIKTRIEDFAYRPLVSSVKFKAVLIGISTGGPPALQEILPKFPQNFPIPIVIAQHMPPGFTKAMAERLNSICKLNVVEAEDGDILEKGKIFIGKGGYHILIKKKVGVPYLHITKEPEDTLYHPQIDLLFKSAVESLNGEVIAVIMTGMGQDGVNGLELLKKAGAYIIAQDKKTSAIFGMPKAAIERKIVDIVLPLEKIPEEIINKLNIDIK